MGSRFLALLGALAITVAVASLASAPVAGQAPSAATNTTSTAQRTQKWTPPRTAWGRPDLQGIWNNATTTPLERPDKFSGKTVLSDEELSQLTEEVGRLRNTDQAPPQGDPGTYNEFWWERGKPINQTSLILDPPDGKLPALTPDGQKRADAAAANRRGRGPADSWEDRGLGERCIIYRGIPTVPTGYNNNYQIVQTPQYVGIFQEHIHETRIIPVDGRPHVGPRIRQWLGDSRGRWDGDTLVVETTNFNDKALVRGFNGVVSESFRVVERFTRIDAETIDYQFTVDDPKTWTRPWSGKIPMRKIQGPIFEYACHEGNYAMAGILGGHRADERAAEEGKKTSSR